jgi:CRP/FNR family transcriptional regulator
VVGGQRHPTPGSSPAEVWERLALSPPARAALIEPALWQALVVDGEVVTIPAGDLIYEAGQVPPVLGILSGSARVFMWGPADRQFTLRYARSREVIGLGPRLAGVDTTSAEAVTDTTAAILAMDTVRERAVVNPALAWALTEQAAGWASEAVRSLVEVARLPMTARVAAHLLQASVPAPGSDAVLITHQRLADAVGTAREVVTRALATLREAGVVHTSPGQVVITDASRLELIACGDENIGRPSRLH